MKRVILAANNHPDYSFLAPLTAILWATRTGYRPAVFTVRVTGVLDFLAKSGVIDLFPVTVKHDRMAIKLTRWYSYTYFPWMGSEEGDRLLLMDVDCWPINGAFWDREKKARVVCHYGDAFQGKAHTTLGFEATCKALQEIAPGNADERLKQIRKLPEDDERRHSDDAAQSLLVLAWMDKHPGQSELIKRGPSPPKDRIDRSRWDEDMFALDVDDCDFVDAHLPRDASDRRVWRTIYPLLKKLAPDWAGWARAYRDEWERSCV